MYGQKTNFVNVIGVVLTSAHCVDRKEPQILKIRAGEWDTQVVDRFFTI